MKLLKLSCQVFLDLLRYSVPMRYLLSLMMMKVIQLSADDDSDRLQGTNGTDIIEGLKGNDEIFGANDNDILLGGDD